MREWPSSVEAPQAQLRFAKILAKEQEDYVEAFAQLEYLFDFYARDCPYLELVEYGYKLVNTMRDKKKTWFGLSFLSNKQVRRNYESIVRRAPSAPYVPEAMLKIAELREEELEYEEAVKVYESLSTKYPLRTEARTAAYREARARMWLCRRLAYNMSRCGETRGFLRQVMKRYPDIEQMEELKTWLEELEKYMDEAAYKNAKSYDSRRRTVHAARSAWGNARWNRVGTRVRTLCGDASLLQLRSYDIILANIHRNIIIEDLSTYVRSLKRGGTILLSGFFDDDVSAIEKAAGDLKMKTAARFSRGGWACIMLQ